MDNSLSFSRKRATGLQNPCEWRPDHESYNGSNRNTIPATALLYKSVRKLRFKQIEHNGVAVEIRSRFGLLRAICLAESFAWITAVSKRHLDHVKCELLPFSSCFGQQSSGRTFPKIPSRSKATSRARSLKIGCSMAGSRIRLGINLQTGGVVKLRTNS